MTETLKTVLSDTLLKCKVLLAEAIDLLINLMKEEQGKVLLAEAIDLLIDLMKEDQGKGEIPAIRKM